MGRWKDKKDLFLWIDKEKLNAKENLTCIDKNQRDKETMMEGLRLIHILETDTSLLKNKITQEIFEYLNLTSSKMTVNAINVFIETIEDIKYFKKSKLSTDGKEFKREIEQLKKSADTLQFYSNNSIEIKLPRLPHVCIYIMVKVLKMYKIDEESIKVLNSYFDRKRLPSANISIEEDCTKMEYAVMVMEEALKSGFYENNKSMINTIVSEIADYYIPDIRLSYHRKLSQKKT